MTPPDDERTATDVLDNYGVRIPFGVGDAARRYGHKLHYADYPERLAKLRRSDGTALSDTRIEVLDPSGDAGLLVRVGPAEGDDDPQWDYWALPEGVLGTLLRRLVETTDFVVTDGGDHLPEADDDGEGGTFPVNDHVVGNAGLRGLGENLGTVSTTDTSSGTHSFHTTD